VSFRLATVVSLHDSLETDVMRKLPRKLGSVEANQVWANLTRDHALLGASFPAAVPGHLADPKTPLGFPRLLSSIAM